MFNGRHGLFVSGGDANAGNAINLQAQANCRWGIYDRAFLGNTYVACMSEANGHINAGPKDPHPSFGGAYRTTNLAARNVLLGCYTEGDQISRIVHPTMVVGGNIVGGGIEHDPGNRLPVIITNEGSTEVDDLRVHGPIATQVRSVGLLSAFAPQPIDPLDSAILVNAESNQPGVFGPVPLILPSLDDP
jgi:hypothetical protein